MYEFVIGGWGNTASVIRRESQGANKVSVSNKPCNSQEFVDYWIRIKDGVLSCGFGSDLGMREMMKWKDPNIQDVKYVGFSTWDVAVEYRCVVTSKTRG